MGKDPFRFRLGCWGSRQYGCDPCSDPASCQRNAIHLTRSATWQVESWFSNTGRYHGATVFDGIFRHPTRNRLRRRDGVDRESTTSVVSSANCPGTDGFVARRLDERVIERHESLLFCCPPTAPHGNETAMH